MKALRIRNDDIDELLEGKLRRDKVDIDFGIEDGIDYSENDNENKEGRAM